MRRLGVLGAVPLFKGGPEIEFTVPLLTVPLVCAAREVCVRLVTAVTVPLLTVPLILCGSGEMCGSGYFILRTPI